MVCGFGAPDPWVQLLSRGHMSAAWKRFWIPRSLLMISAAWLLLLYRETWESATLVLEKRLCFFRLFVPTLY